MKKTLSSLSIAAAVSVALLSVSGIAQAGDCKGVKFKFTNKWKVANEVVEIKVKKIYVDGNDKNWNEDIANKNINPNATYTTNKRRLNGLDSGKTGKFTVHFDHRKIGPGWQSATHGPFSFKCDDNKTIAFTIMN
ncbi:MAG: hypothetical protein R3E68_10380 [Burkholderiaceae bacterium]